MGFPELKLPCARGHARATHNPRTPRLRLSNNPPCQPIQKQEGALFLAAKRDPRLVSTTMSWIKPTCFYYRRCLHTNLGSIYLSICGCETKLVTTPDEKKFLVDFKLYFFELKKLSELSTEYRQQPPSSVDASAIRSSACGAVKPTGATHPPAGAVHFLLLGLLHLAPDRRSALLMTTSRRRGGV